MRNIFSAINLSLVLIIVLLATLSIRIWTSPKYPDRIDAASVTPASKTAEPLSLIRKNNNSGVIASVVQGNLFRKGRKAFRPEPTRSQPVAQLASNASLPPPDLKLKGVMLLGTRRIAIMEGHYPVREANQTIKQKPLKKKGYPLGSQIGGFELTEIEKNNVTLDNKRGVIINLNLSQRPADKIIRKVGNNLVQKSKNFDPRKIKKETPPRPKPSPRTTAEAQNLKPRQAKSEPRQRSFRISGAPTQLQGNAPKPRISGR